MIKLLHISDNQNLKNKNTNEKTMLRCLQSLKSAGKKVS